MNYMDFQPHVLRERNEQMQREVDSLRLGEHLRSVPVMSSRAIQKEEKEEAKMASIRTMLITTMLTIMGILAMMVMVSVIAPDSASARPKLNSVQPTCKAAEKRIAELEEKKEAGTITKEEQGELNSLNELRDALVCNIKDVKDAIDLRGDAGEESSGGVDPTVGNGSMDDGCTWKNLWCKLAPVVEVAQTIASPDPGPTNPTPEPLPPLDPRPEPPDPLPPAPVPLGELSKESSGDPDSSGSSDVDADAQNNATSMIKTAKKSDLEADGYTCSTSSLGAETCTKRGPNDEKLGPDYTCDVAGDCFSAKITNPNGPWGLPKAPTNAGLAKAQPQSLEPAPQQHTEETVASPSAGEVQGEVSSDQYSSAEALR